MRGSTSGAQTGRNWLLEACSQAAKLRTGCIARQRDMSTERSGVRMGTAVLEKNKPPAMQVCPQKALASSKKIIFYSIRDFVIIIQGVIIDTLIKNVKRDLKVECRLLLRR